MATVGMPFRRQLRDVVERLPAGNEDLALGRQVRPTGLDQIDDRQPVLASDLIGAQRLAHGHRIRRAAADRGVVGHDQALRTFDHADADDDTGPDGKVGSPRSERREFEERRLDVEKASTRSRASSLSRWR